MNMMTVDRLRLAKQRYSRACAAYLRNDPGAAERCQRALAELEAAFLARSIFGAEECNPDAAAMTVKRAAK